MLLLWPLLVTILKHSPLGFHLGGFLGAGNRRRTNNINDPMKIKKPTRLVKTDKQAESALIVFFSMIAGSLLIAVAIILHHL